jgi:prepilin-type N-terminal cleavage/methylation domain-containing protein
MLMEALGDMPEMKPYGPKGCLALFIFIYRKNSDKHEVLERLEMKRKGFTLIELLVVIAIIALLLSVLVPSLRKVKDAAKLMLCANNQHQTLTSLFAYAVDNDSIYPPHPAEKVDNQGKPYWGVVNYLNYAQAKNTGRSVNEGTYHYLGSYLPLVDMFACPLGHAKDLSELQWQYENYKTVRLPYYTGEGTQTSYNLYWGGYEFTAGILGAGKFKGPNKGARGIMWRSSGSINFQMLLVVSCPPEYGG